MAPLPASHPVLPGKSCGGAGEGTEPVRCPGATAAPQDQPGLRRDAPGRAAGAAPGQRNRSSV